MSSRHPIQVPGSQNLRWLSGNLLVGSHADIPDALRVGARHIVTLWSATAALPLAEFTSVLRRPIHDREGIPADVLAAVVDYVRQHRGSAPVLFQCQAGMSRSAGVAYACLRKLDGLSHSDALRRVQVIPQYPDRTLLRSVVDWLRDP